MALVVVVLLVNGYASSYVGTYWLAGRGVISRNDFNTLRDAVYGPLYSYQRDNRPGSNLLADFTLYAWLKGSGKPTTWKGVRERVGLPRKR